MVGLRAPRAIVNVGRLEVFESAPRVYGTSGLFTRADSRLFESAPRVYGTSRLLTRTDSRLFESVPRPSKNRISGRSGNTILEGLISEYGRKIVDMFLEDNKLPTPLAVHTAVPFGHLWTAS